ncbi:MAG: 6-phosphofructokinase, partial [Nitrospinota bacterium]
VLGHIQRGGTPSTFDRNLATRFGVHAVELAAAGRFGRMVALRAGQVTAVPLDENVKGERLVPLDSDYLRVARSLGTSFGD